MPEVKLTLATLQEGAAAERFDRELERVMRNIADPNTPEKSKRKIVLEVTLSPSEGHREDVWITTKVSSKLAPPRAIESRGYIEEDGEGGFVAMETHRNQMRGQVAIEDAVPVEEPKESNVREIKAAGKAR